MPGSLIARIEFVLPVIHDALYLAPEWAGGDCDKLPEVKDVALPQPPSPLLGSSV